MSGRDLLKQSLASHAAQTKAEKRRSGAQKQGRGSRVKRVGNYFSGFGGINKGRGIGQNHAQFGNDDPTSTQPYCSETTTSDGKLKKLNVLTFYILTH